MTAKKDGSPTRVGNNVLIMTVLPFWTGHIVAVTKDEIVLVQAAWIPDTGRFSEVLARGRDVLAEVEIVPPTKRVAVARGSNWAGDLPEATR